MTSNQQGPPDEITSQRSDGGYSDSTKSELTSGKTSSTSTGEPSTSESLKKELARRETNFIFSMRVLVICLLILVAAGVSALVFIITSNAEQEEFETQFDGASQQILEAFEAIKTDRISALSSLAVAAIAHGVDHSRSWPFVALSSFQQRSLTARSNSGILQVSINPFVSEEHRSEWERYVVEEKDSDWIQEAHEYQGETGVNNFIIDYGDNFNIGITSQSIAYYNPDDSTRHNSTRNSGPYLPFWEHSPLLSNDHINIDILADLSHATYAKLCIDTGAVVLGGMESSSPGGMKDDTPHSPTSRYAQLLSIAAQKETEYLGDPMTYVYIPIFDSFRDDRVTKGVMTGIFNWANFFGNILPPHVVGVDVVLDNHCYQSFTYRINGDYVIPIGEGDLHEHKFDDMEVSSGRLEQGTIADGTKSALSFHEGECFHTISVYPSTVFLDTYTSGTPAIITFAVAIIFAFAVAMFIVYDRLVERRQKLVLQKAVQSTAIVSSLFPKNVRDRLMQTTLEKEPSGPSVESFRSPKLKNLIGEHFAEGGAVDNNQPIADLFPNCTVLFADISGFTAWSSTRDPAQVFTLLQAVYQAFDKIAARRRVFKVETIGDSYVAVTGLPEPQDAHAVIMARFASECRIKLFKVTQKLEIILGPDTGDLSMRFGLHSGPVTAGVLRGDRARFQLFGDTVNTAARMESTGMSGKIQVSASTAELLRNAGKTAWTTPRIDVVFAKGLGKVNTFWLEIDSKYDFGDINNSDQQDEVGGEVVVIKTDRLVDWMTEMISDHLKKVFSKRAFITGQGDKFDPASTLTYSCPEGQTCLDEVVEALSLPKYDGKGLYGPNNVSLPKEALAQLREYVSVIADHYNNNPFHNFDHACHVTMSVHKLLKRVTTPDISEEDLVKGRLDGNHLASRLHDYTHGINSDPLISLAIMFSALIHDVDHRGVSNVQMGKEEPEMAEYYKQKSIAEQNSLDVAWDLLMSKRFDELRSCMFGNQGEMMRFRQALVNIVLATDIFDKELNDLRKLRWEKAFHTDSQKIDNNLRATIVLEHIIQASDVSHTMQHWHVYLKFNRRLFKEMTLAYRAGRMGADPASFWYEGELKFFDNYIIPLAMKLKECQVFGVSSDEYLNYAKSNRMEWQEKGVTVLQDMMAELSNGS